MSTQLWIEQRRQTEVHIFIVFGKREKKQKDKQTNKTKAKRAKIWKSAQLLS